jgi:hypothetical protein
LTIGAVIGASDGSHCAHSAARPVQLQLDESAVLAWHPDDASWDLATAAQDLTDRCFTLQVDGQVLARGMVLSSYSARMSHLPVLRVSRLERGARLQLMAGNGSRPAPLHAALLGAVLAGRAQP